MPLFKSIPAVSTQKDTIGPINRKPDTKVTKKDFEVRKPLSDSEEDALLRKYVKELDEDAPEPIYFEEDEELPKVEEKKEEVKPEVKPMAKKEPKMVAKVSAPKTIAKEEKPLKVEEKPKPTVKDEALKPVIKEEASVAQDRPLTPEEKKARQMENLRKARLARLGMQEKENDTMAATKPAAEKPKKLVTEPKKAVDMSKMVMTAKKPKETTSGKTVYHVSKRGETREDRVWKVFIQESNKVIKLFDYQEDALKYAKQLAKNKDDGSYVILHGLDGKIRKF